MPYWCLNGLDVRGPENDVRTFAGTVGTADCDGCSTSLRLQAVLAAPTGSVYPETWCAQFAKVMVRAEGRICYTFETAWEPPITLLLRVSRVFTALTFTLAYSEPCNDIRSMVSVLDGDLSLHRLPDIGPYPDEAEYADEILLAQDQEDYCQVYDGHVWGLVTASG